MTKIDKFNTVKLQDKETRKLFQKAVRDELVKTGDTKHSILKVAEKVLEKETRVAKKPWIDE